MSYLSQDTQPLAYSCSQDVNVVCAIEFMVNSETQNIDDGKNVEKEELQMLHHKRAHNAGLTHCL